MDNDYYQPKKSWWDKNWKWFVPTGCLSIIAILVVFVGILFFGITSVMENSDAFKGAMDATQHNQLVIEKLGKPIETDGMISGNIETSDSKGNCNLQIPIKGPKGTATLFVVATKKGKWSYSELSVYINNTDEEIDLLKK